VVGVRGDPRKRTICSAPDPFHLLTEDQSLDGSDMLSGRSLLLRDVFSPLAEEQAPTKRSKR
jgi:hypothetical protein